MAKTRLKLIDGLVLEVDETKFSVNASYSVDPTGAKPADFTVALDLQVTVLPDKHASAFERVVLVRSQ